MTSCFGPRIAVGSIEPELAGRTKTDVTRRVPVHPTLAKILAAWKLSHWERVYGRAPGADDLIVPARTMGPIAASDAGRMFKDDLRGLGLRTAADRRVTDGDHGSDHDADGTSRTEAVASLATALADAVLAGDDERARALAEELRVLEAAPAAPPLRRVR